MGLRADHAALMERYLAQFRGGPSPRASYDDDYVEVYPQSGEQLVGPSEAIEAIRRQPAGVTLAGSPHLTSCGEDRVLARGRSSTTAGRGRGSSALFETHAGRFHRTTAYFGDPFEAPAWRAAWAERFDPLDPAAWDGDGDGRPVEEADVDRVVRAAIGGDIEVVRAAAHPDYRGSFPQSGERFDFAGLEAVDAHYPGGLPEMELNWLAGATERWIVNPANVPVRVTGGGDLWAGEVLMRYPSGERYFGVTVQVLPRATGLAPALLLLRPVRGGLVPGRSGRPDRPRHGPRLTRRPAPRDV